jgi:N-acetylglucosaminyldiphosphoundecaprenol N-acetyl-beta-D-mannosaminyltransferase
VEVSATSNPSQTQPPRQITLVGIPLDALTHREVADRVLRDLDAGKGGYIVTPNLDILRGTTRDPDLRRLALSAELRVVDGMPLIWAGHIRGTPFPDRVAGSDLIWTLSGAAADHRRSIFLLGGSPGTARLAGDVLTRRFVGLRIVGTYCPPIGYDMDRREMALICAELRRTRPDVVYVGLPFRKASVLVALIRDHLEATWFVEVGVSFSFVSGAVNRAPIWMQRAGFEWFHRLAQEPRRLFRRYVFEDIPFVRTLFLSALADRRSLAWIHRVAPAVPSDPDV